MLLWQSSNLSEISLRALSTSELILSSTPLIALQCHRTRKRNHLFCDIALCPVSVVFAMP
jgi:hypothetical protein